MTEKSDWAEFSNTKTTHLQSWSVSKDGQLVAVGDVVSLGISARFEQIAVVIAEITIQTHGDAVLKISLKGCRYGGHGPDDDLDLGSATVPRRLSGGWDSDDPKAMERLFELAQEAAEKAAAFYATMVKAWEGTFTEDLKDE